MCPVESKPKRKYGSRILISRTTYCGYELSPSPNDVKIHFSRKFAASFLLLNLLKKSCAFLGKSPWPVVDMTISTIEALLSCCGVMAFSGLMVVHMRRRRVSWLSCTASSSALPVSEPYATRAECAMGTKQGENQDRNVTVFFWCRGRHEARRSAWSLRFRVWRRGTSVRVRKTAGHNLLLSPPPLSTI